MTYKLIKTADLVEIKDIPSANLPAHLRMFMIRVQKIFPLCSFAQAGERERGQLPDANTQKIYVYHKHKPLVMGWIGYGDFRYQSNDRSDDYVVNSRKIANGKYSAGTHNFFTVMSANIKVAMRNVSKYLVDYGPGELAEAYSSNAAGFWSNTATTLASNLRAAGNELIPPFSYAAKSEISPLEAELQILVNGGHKFIDPQFSERVDKLLSARKEIIEDAQGRSPVLTMVSVEVSPTSGNTLFVVARTEDINGRDINSPSYTASWAPKGTFVEDTLDRDIMGKLATLQMCEVDHWVDGVGYRPTDTLFYVVQ